MGLLVMLVGLSSVVFSTTVKAHRKASATIEIMRNLRVLTEQLNADFRGLRTDAPLFFGFNRIGIDEDGDTNPDYYLQFDMMHFFADGDFQTVREYMVRWDSDGDGVLETSDGFRDEIIYGNIARVFYGHANSVDLVANPAATLDFDTYHVLSRKSHILTSHDGVIFDLGEIPLITNGSGVIDYTPFDDLTAGFGLTTHQAGFPPKTYTDENGWEFNTITLTNWVNALNYLDLPGNIPNNANHFITHCLTDAYRPYIDVTDYNTLHLLMAQGVMDFSVQWAYTPDDLAGLVPGFTAGIRWWPSVDPDGNPATNDSDFAGNPFGVYFTLPNGTSYTSWLTIDNYGTNGVLFSSTFYPKALKFTFRLKDSNNIFSDGKTFTHIVYLDN